MPLNVDDSFPRDADAKFKVSGHVLYDSDRYATRHIWQVCEAWDVFEQETRGELEALPRRAASDTGREKGSPSKLLAGRPT